MKSTIKALIAAAFAISLATSVTAAPPGKGTTGAFKGATTQAEIQKLKKGDHYALVCTDCKSITVKEVADEKEVEALCHEGGTVHCDSCKKKVTIKRVGPPGKESITSKITIVNAEGKECMFIVPMKD
jgi:ribosomal protein L37AE/L43A